MKTLNTIDLAKKLQDLTDEKEWLEEDVEEAKSVLEEMENNACIEDIEEAEETLAEAIKELTKWEEENLEEFEELENMELHD